MPEILLVDLCEQDRNPKYLPVVIVCCTDQWANL